MINLEVPKKAGALINQAYQAAAEVFRPIPRKYDLASRIVESVVVPTTAGGRSCKGR